MAGLVIQGGCSDDETCTKDCTPATVVRMDFADTGDFFASPFPSDARRDASGKPIVDGFPNPQAVFLVDRVLDVIRADAKGFGVSSGVFFATTGPLDSATLPSLHDSVESGASVFLVAIDGDAPDYLVKAPVSVRFSADPGLYGPKNMLSLVPLQGAPLRPLHRYAAVVTRAVASADGRPLGVSEAVSTLVAGGTPAGMTEDVAADYRTAFDALAAASIAIDNVAALTVFTTDDPVATMGKAVERSRSDSMPPSAPFAKTDEFETFCVYATTIEMPVYQSGEPPYLEEGGGWVTDEQGSVVLDHYETARFVVSIPKGTMPPSGYPTVVFSRTGAGGDRPLVDRGVRAVPGGEAVTPGSGPGLEFASVGFAGASIDGPHGGLRNITEDDEQFLVFNFQNPIALRDNVRQSAVELALVPGIFEGLSIDVSDCDGAVAPDNQVSFDPDTFAIMGHSMGASIAPLALVFEPRYRAMLLSGAGGSFLQNMIHKQKPIPVKPLAELILALATSGYSLNEEDPMLSMLQWAGEPADDPIYGRHVIREPLVGGPRHVLMMQGIVDHYIMPPIANATSLSFGLDLAGTELDVESEELAALYPPEASLGSLLALVGKQVIALPAMGNGSSDAGEVVTAVVTQNAEDGIEDGHEVVYQTEGPKRAYRCFLSGLKSEQPRVPAPAAGDAPCE